MAGHGGHQRGGVGPQHGDVGARLRRALHTGGAGGGPGVERSFDVMDGDFHSIFNSNLVYISIVSGTIIYWIDII